LLLKFYKNIVFINDKIVSAATILTAMISKIFKTISEYFKKREVHVAVICHKQSIGKTYCNAL